MHFADSTLASLNLSANVFQGMDLDGENGVDPPSSPAADNPMAYLGLRRNRFYQSQFSDRISDKFFYPRI
jgi:hypothetical protein